MTDVKRALAESNDIFFYALGGLWQIRIRRQSSQNVAYQVWFWSKNVFTERGVGLVPDDTGNAIELARLVYWRFVSFSDRPGILTTPLQLVMATAAIANGGELLTPIWWRLDKMQLGIKPRSTAKQLSGSRRRCRSARLVRGLR